MNCKECIHEDVCKEWQYSISGSYIHPICRKPNHFKRKDKEHVRHGRWINEPPYRCIDGKYLKAQMCSECNAFYISDGNMPYSNHNYCPDCGADMRGEKE